MHPHILCKHKLLFWMQLIAINRLTALVQSYQIVMFLCTDIVTPTLLYKNDLLIILTPNAFQSKVPMIKILLPTS